jgi:hypothetical protein
LNNSVSLNQAERNKLLSKLLLTVRNLFAQQLHSIDRELFPHAEQFERALFALESTVRFESSDKRVILFKISQKSQ